MSRGNVRVRPASPSDIAELIALSEDNGVTEHIGRRGRKGDTTTLADRYSLLLSDPDRLVLVAVEEEHDKLVGFSVLLEEQVGVLAPTSTMYISHLLVAPSYRRRGAGRALLTGAVRHAEDRDIDHVVVGVQAAARDANRYLARLGFAPLVVRRIASVSALRRSLGIADSIDRVALRRRRTVRGVLPNRVIGRGA
ncbi:GNAT family N-acetyltransferase [Jatrophihabitans telluris]|uniref:GNAT family N-acetyltransferase n=1 Tax=Jatrophihabitans telluris TaxID=2038343 RepID=A0ABY4QTY5_9ACTN|nr:GNAT family N-acetyltransferase [Jatrophihabitans telluris]UQX87139.1 GNAT family N-acetyltransferase [Jatrophihabitans telluris]